MIAMMLWVLGVGMGIGAAFLFLAMIADDYEAQKNIRNILITILVCFMITGIAGATLEAFAVLPATQ